MALPVASAGLTMSSESEARSDEVLSLEQARARRVPPAIRRLELRRERTVAVLQDCAQQTDRVEAEMERIERVREAHSQILIRIDDAILRRKAAIDTSMRALEAERGIGGPDRIARLSLRDRVLVLMDDNLPRTVAEVAEEISGAYHSVGKAMQLLHESGHLKRLPDGRYQIGWSISVL